MTRLDRRQLLNLIAGGAAATLAACGRPNETIHPLANQPEEDEPGRIRRYATALPIAGYLRGVTGLVVDGRPIKLEGLAAHPASLGATDLFTEVSILDLYDPQRLKAPMGPDGPTSWPALARALWEATAPRRGEGFAVLTGRVTSPTLLARLAALRAALPGMRVVRWEPFDDDAMRAGTTAAFGRALTPRPRLGETDRVICLGADPLGPGPDQIAFARAWANRRRRAPFPQLLVAESSLTATGAMADVRIAAGPGQLAALAETLLNGRAADASAGPLATVLEASGRTLVLAGASQPGAIHAAAAHLNAKLGAPVDYIAPVDADARPHGAGLAALVRDMHRGHVDTLLVLDANPAYAAPPGLRLADAMARVRLSVVASSLPTETSARAGWTAPLSHPLETWHDGRAPDGTVSIAQPLIRPLYDTLTPVELIDLILNPAGGPGAYRRVRETWAGLGEAGWREAAAGGVVPNTAAKPETVSLVAAAIPAIAPTAGGFVVEIRPSPTLYDGRWSANAWAQECPDPLTKEVWGACARLHPSDMAALGLADGDLVHIRREGAVTLSARADPHQAMGVVTVLTGYGRSASGAVAEGLGANAFVLQGVGPARLSKAGGAIIVPSQQHQFRLDGELAKLFPMVAPGEALPKPPPRKSLINPPHRDAPPTQWAMAIDTDVCIGCNACVVACQAENNVPAIGPEEIAVGRDLHWLRVDRYDVPSDGGPTTGFQPVPCMQCEAAPCEPVCPVEASVHDAQGLNLQVYNRCVGTRTCQANCPYKVRRFNFRDYAGASLWGDAGDASVSAQRNPDVTVRARGVMEKCTYCVHRIEAADREADAGGQPAPVVTACAAACPTRAITFGPLGSDAIERARADPRHYALLEELGTRPRTTYLARRRGGS